MKGLWTAVQGSAVEWRPDNDKRGGGNIIARMPLPPDVQTKRDLRVTISLHRLLVQYTTSAVSGPETALEEEFARPVLAEESTWTIEEEDGRRGKFLVLHLAKKNDSDTWPSLFKSERATNATTVPSGASVVSSGAVTAPSAPGLSEAQLEKQKKARAASDLIVLRGLMEKLGPEGKSEIESMLARGANPSDVLKMIQAQRQGKIKPK